MNIQHAKATDDGNDEDDRERDEDPSIRTSPSNSSLAFEPGMI